MARTLEWKVRLFLSEENGTTKARAVLDTGGAALTGLGVARCSPDDLDVPEIGDELAAGRALGDVAQQLLGIAERDIHDMAAPLRGRAREPVLGWPT
ncbi:DUF1876 domain-containing protein [Streptomyces meridianus]|uniref:DUF1876 domain-containing protein n=1 Tax=Streptomyces meridianus TaxID=2938945 RepID=A0ABT0X4E7_9ACTN|nr:DUF1876 domain-containing protein [Streptomyces meridianus]MCM2577420.1 DUF1876 domain-containing protein [Streptomyces meridianus]